MKAVITIGLLIAVLWVPLARAQTTQVTANELQLDVIVEDPQIKPRVGEMVLITIRGIYRRHITREHLVQPSLDGFNWSQMGVDDWHEEWIDGQRVKVMERRMALFPTQSGLLTIDGFRHQLTLTDEGDDWFEHEIQSDPLQVQVDPTLQTSSDNWWFPVRRLEISDEWSNAPDQLEPGQGVLRIIRVKAVGATPEMIPPMPDLTSPSALIFAHPEKRLVELSPEGPITHAFWRWTIQPSNDVSTILEPIEIPYFDTTTRQEAVARISPERVAFLAQTPPKGKLADAPSPANGSLPGFGVLATAVGVAALAVLALLRGDRFRIERRCPIWLDPQVWALWWAVWRKDLPDVRRRAVAVMQKRAQSDPEGIKDRKTALFRLDQSLFGRVHQAPDLQQFLRDFLAKAPGTTRREN